MPHVGEANKDDAADVEAITRPTTRFVPIKEVLQQKELVLQRVKEMLFRRGYSSLFWGHQAEFGIIAPNRTHNFRLLTTLIVDEE
ncbi:hypothetical protein G6L89_024940 (plasmid) [Agrobacterium fabrum]|uniref:hypothetical protein n=1 Tax=Agrobacterium fabrum TaxID=1176649 RepID=UPI0015741323|nr:hypothetical protein [Agrobacterium fabrum]NTB11060.1 hypothetical protein [Agrobacterium fabrum]